jgi:two-component system phosphate regulon sensor histidine kinase PhoR
MTIALRSPRALAGSALGVVRRRQSYLNLLYLLASFPVGTVYFIALVGAVATITGSLLGIVLLPFALYAWRALAKFERQLDRWWLGVEIGPFEQPMPTRATFWQTVWERMRIRLTDRVTWSSLLYLLVKFPFGALTFTLLVALVALTAALLAAPFAVALQFSVDGGLARGFSALTAAGYFVLGVALVFVTLHLANVLAWVWGRFARFALSMSDTTLRLADAQAARARAEAQAARAEQSRRELIVNASHELRTPIASIRAHVESLLLSGEDAEGGQPEPAELRSYLQIIERESDRLSALVDDLLALARADSGELRLDVRPIQAADVAQEVYEAMAPLAKRERQVTLMREMGEDLPLVLADWQRLAQVLLNLVRNAITYTPAGGIVSIRAERAEPGYVRLVVADTGAGIPPEELERVFDRFYRTDASRARASGGFGLGLAIVRDLVQAMGGSVRAESMVGEGSHFIVTLRAVAEPAAPISSAPERLEVR